MSNNEVVIVGSSGHAKVVIDIFEKSGAYDIVGLVDPLRQVGEKIMNYRILGSLENLPQLLRDRPNCKIFIAIGDNWIRKQEYDRITGLLPDIGFATAVHPSAQIGSGVTIGKGTAIMAGAVINSDTVVGDFVIVNTKASADHENHLGNFSSLAPNVTLGGKVTIGEFTAVGIGATALHGVAIGKHCLIGAGSLILRDCSDNVVVYGVPAKVIRNRREGDKYL